MPEGQAGALLNQRSSPEHDFGRHSAGGYQQVLHAFVRTPDFFENGPKEEHQRSALVGFDIAESYLAGDVYLRVGMFWGDSPAWPKIGKHYARIEIASLARDNQPSKCVRYLEVADSSYSAACSNGDEFHVLVDVAHSARSAKRVVRSIVRPESNNLFEQIAIKFVDLVGPALAFEVSHAFAARKLDLFGIDPSGADPGQCNNDLIERRTHLVDHLSRQDVYDLWRLRIEDDFREFVTGLRLRIEHDPARVLLEELPLGSFQLDEMVVCAV